MIRPRDGLSPTTPQHEAGARIDPPPSLASAIGIMRDATAETAPPLEPPAVTAVFHGFSVGPYMRGSVAIHHPCSGTLVRPRIFRPYALIRRTISESDGLT